MANFDYIPIYTKAKKIEKMANMEINEGAIDENSNDLSFPTSKAVFEHTSTKLDINDEIDIIFQGGGAETEVNIDLTVDEILSPTSENLVKNKTIAKEFLKYTPTDNLDFQFEQYSTTGELDKRFEQYSTTGENEKKYGKGSAVGDIWIGGKDANGTPINPATKFGGTWELIDKEFKSQAISEANDGGKMFINSSPDFEQSKPLEHYEIYAILAGHTIRFRFRGDLTFAMEGDTEYRIGTIVLSSIGISTLYHTLYSIPFMGDAGNGLIIATIEKDGKLSVNDTIKATKANEALFINEEFTCKYDNMLDSFCDKFYWKRTK